MALMSYFKDFLNLIYPNLCLTCGQNLPKGEKYLCPACWLDIPRTGFHHERENPVEQIFWGRFPIQYGTALFYFTKGSRYQRLIHEMKYNRKKEIGFELGKKLGEDLKNSVFSRMDYIIPVPLHKRKERKRGFNQSEWIAKGAGEILNIPVATDVLLRKKYTRSQTRKSRYDRWKNVERVFEIKNEEKITNKYVLLIDDILTTGATLEACANTLLQAKDVNISVATLGLADY